MADYTVLAEIGGAIVELLRENLTPEPIGNREVISLCSPHESENNQLTLYLFHIEEEKQNTQSSYFRSSQDVERMQPTPYNLSFLLTAHSKAPAQMKEADQYRMLGAAVQTIKDHPVLDSKFLTGSSKDTGLVVHLSVERPSFDQMIKIWNNTSSPYRLSIVIKATGVTIDSKRVRGVAPRVTDVAIDVRDGAEELQKR